MEMISALNPVWERQSFKYISQKLYLNHQEVISKLGESEIQDILYFLEAHVPEQFSFSLISVTDMFGKIQ